MADKPVEIPDMSGKTVVVTGASSGIGRVTALRLAAAGARVLVHGRSPERTADIARRVGTEPLVADCASLDQVRSLAARILGQTDHIDVMLHNAGAVIGKRTLTADGHELTFQGNHLAPFLLQHLLQPVIVSTPGSRVIVVASRANRHGHVYLDDLDHERGRYHGIRVYGASKLENILFVRELSRRLKGTSTASVAVHPGDVASGFGAASVFPGVFYRLGIRRLYLISEEEGAEPLLHLATLPDPCAVDGLYFDRLKPRGATSRQADDLELARGLWERSEDMVKPWL
jgi:NAD(P)-dependent dehydrogenase (short-subunit alcohol dehydrogenase family)